MPMPIDYRDLILAISTATMEGRVRWNAKQDEYSVILPDAVIVLWSGVDLPRHQSFVGFTLRDADRHLIDAWRVDHRDADYAAMEALVAGAKRNASQLANKLGTLTEFFNNTPVIGDNSDAAQQPSPRYAT